MNGMSQEQILTALKDHRSLVVVHWGVAEENLVSDAFDADEWEIGYYRLVAARDEMNLMIDDVRRYLKQKSVTLPVVDA